MSAHSLILIGGIPRTGKTLSAQKLSALTGINLLSSDMLRCAARNVIFDEPYVAVEKLQLTGTLQYHRPGVGLSETKEFYQILDESIFGWKAVCGAVDYYDRHGMSVIIEGEAITPDRAKELQLKLLNLKLSAVFIGFTNKKFLDNIFKYSEQHADWVSLWRKEVDESVIRQWSEQQAVKSAQIKELCHQYGYMYHDVSEATDSLHIMKVVNSLLRKVYNET